MLLRIVKVKMHLYMGIFGTIIFEKRQKEIGFRIAHAVSNND